MKNVPSFSHRIFFSLAFIFLLSACGKDKGASHDNSQPKKGYATGKVTDAQGKPIAGAKILLDNTIVYAAYINSTTGNDGTYSVKMPTGAYGVWKAYATITKEYNGKSYSLDLCPDNTNSFNEDGAVCNFTWKLTGKVPNDDYAYYGGSIDMDVGVGSVISSWDNVIITLTPAGTLIDGSQGQPITVKFGDEHWKNYTNGIKDIPMGRYKATAVF
ncbi:MAG: carboxypeptidase-like regulatory domain-containing protein, partial [Chitinophagaceae bacterium]